MERLKKIFKYIDNNILNKPLDPVKFFKICTSLMLIMILFSIIVNIFRHITVKEETTQKYIEVKYVNITNFNNLSQGTVVYTKSNNSNEFYFYNF